jgi:hypothetical protein
MHSQQFVIESIMEKGIRDASALQSFFAAAKSNYSKLNPSQHVDAAEADAAIAELRRDLRL